MNTLFIGITLICTLIILGIIILLVVRKNYNYTKKDLYIRFTYIALIASNGLSHNNITSFTSNNPVIESRILFYLSPFQLSENINQYFNTDKIFVSGDNIDRNFLITSNIFDINTHTQAELEIFIQCGYYTKSLPNSRIIVICGLSAQDICIKQFYTDLRRIQSLNKFVYILSTFPIQIELKNKKIIRGVFTNNRTTHLSKLDDWVGGNMWNIPPSPSYISVPFPLNEPLILGYSDVEK